MVSTLQQSLVTFSSYSQFYSVSGYLVQDLFAVLRGSNQTKQQNKPNKQTNRTNNSSFGSEVVIPALYKASKDLCKICGIIFVVEIYS